MTKSPEKREWIANDGGSGFQAVGVIIKGPEIPGHIILVSADYHDQIVAELKAELANCISLFLHETRMKSLEAARDALAAKCAEYEKALEKYSNLKTEGDDGLFFDAGELAREALRKGRER